MSVVRTAPGVSLGSPALVKGVEGVNYREGSIMTEYIVGLRFEKRSDARKIEAEDALIAALKIKHDHPEAIISYVRKSNKRGDRRHPHQKG